MSQTIAKQPTLEFDLTFEVERAHRQLADPSSYKGLYAFHKYWGKKPHEVLGFIIDQLTDPNDVILDPFMGSGTAGRESLLRDRRFIGGDINPCSVLLTKLLLSPPNKDPITLAFNEVAKSCKERIYESYKTSEGRVATHYLWNESHLQEVWVNGKGRGTSKSGPLPQDIALSEAFARYKVANLRPLRFFTNARINAATDLTWHDIFTGRALRNIEILRCAILEQAEPARSALLLALTASCGQMSRMVFAITGRGKTTGKVSDRIEVGSWVIGFWRPKLHFECNVWDCFDRRATKLLQALDTTDPLHDTDVSNCNGAVLMGASAAAVQEVSCRTLLSSLPSESISLIVTDPPHSDRIPYLELSEIWNALLGQKPDFEEELVASNAKERNKSKKQYAGDLAESLGMMSRVLRPDGFLVLVFNARSAEDWAGLADHMRTSNDDGGLQYAGRFPVHYSAGSVVQDNRAGGLKHDYAMVFRKKSVGGENITAHLAQLRQIPQWQGCEVA